MDQHYRCGIFIAASVAVFTSTLCYIAHEAQTLGPSSTTSEAAYQELSDTVRNALIVGIPLSLGGIAAAGFSLRKRASDQQ